MGPIERKYHSAYKGYEIYHRKDIKRRPWSVLAYPDKKVGRFADRRTIDSCYQLIDRLKRRKK